MIALLLRFVHVVNNYFVFMSTASCDSVLMSSHMYSSDLVETNVDAVTSGVEMYAEVDEMKKMKDSANTAQGKLPQPYLTFVNSE